MGRDAAGEVAGDALATELTRRFVTTVDEVRVRGDVISLLRPRDAESLISEEEFAQDERLPYWADVWPSSIVLARWIAARERRGTAIELGSGLGLATIAAMRAGLQVLATDYYADALRFTRVNAHRALGREPETRLVDWRSLPPDLGRFAWVFAADVLYERPYGEVVAAVIARTLAPRGTGVVADPGRVAAPAFAEACTHAGLSAATEVFPFRAGAIRQRITLYHLRWVASRSAVR